MRKTGKALISTILFFVLIVVGTIGTKIYLKNKLESKYENDIEKKLAKVSAVEKSQGLYIQNKAIESDDVILYGSSELSTTFIPQHPSNLYLDKKINYNISIIGRGYSQDIIHAINIGALKENEKNKKLVIILSPQWFTKEGLTSEGFEANFSQLQFYKLMNKKELSKDLKLKMATRVNSFLVNTSNFKDIKLYTKLYSKNSAIAKLELSILKPYYLIKEQVLELLDLKQSLDIVNNVKKTDEKDIEYKEINWDYEMKKAEENGEKASKTNEYGIYDEYFNKYVKDKYEKVKGSNKGENYAESYEYDDLKLLIQICKELRLDPLLVAVPVHGKWYDYTNFEKSSREEYYNNIREIATVNEIKLLDLSKYEYEKYFFCDVMHLGWKGWVYINEGINKYYNEN